VLFNLDPRDPQLNSRASVSPIFKTFFASLPPPFFKSFAFFTAGTPVGFDASFLARWPRAFLTTYAICAGHLGDQSAEGGYRD
jgi:hypothetical protein